MLHALVFLIGTWNCSSAAGPQQFSYRATFSYALGGALIQEQTSWPGGGGDIGYYGYASKGAYWTFTVLESDGSTTVFHGTGDAKHVVYHTAYPDTSDTEVFDAPSDTTYTTHFSGSFAGKNVVATDTCTKQ